MKVVSVSVPVPALIPMADYTIVSLHSTMMIVGLDRLPSDYSILLLLLLLMMMMNPKMPVMMTNHSTSTTVIISKPVIVIASIIPLVLISEMFCVCVMLLKGYCRLCI